MDGSTGRTRHIYNYGERFEQTSLLLIKVKKKKIVKMYMICTPQRKILDHAQVQNVAPATAGTRHVQAHTRDAQISTTTSHVQLTPQGETD